MFGGPGDDSRPYIGEVAYRQYRLRDDIREQRIEEAAIETSWPVGIDRMEDVVGRRIGQPPYVFTRVDVLADLDARLDAEQSDVGWRDPSMVIVPDHRLVMFDGCVVEHLQVAENSERAGHPRLDVVINDRVLVLTLVHTLAKDSRCI